jgi:hypothetical protein
MIDLVGENLVIACTPPFAIASGMRQVPSSPHSPPDRAYQTDLALGLTRLRRDPRDIAAAMAEHLRPEPALPPY